jgi:hypothetical protein
LGYGLREGSRCDASILCEILRSAQDDKLKHAVLSSHWIERALSRPKN